MRKIIWGLVGLNLLILNIQAQHYEKVEFKRWPKEKKISVLMGGKPFTEFLYPDSLEKPVLYPLYSTSGIEVTRGFPLHNQEGDPTDHPHHIGLWFTFENVNGLDFWNNSYAIPANKKNTYGWIRTDKILKTKNGKIGVLEYHAFWTNQKKDPLLEETTRFEIKSEGEERYIDRITTLKAVQDIWFKDAKDGLLGLRMAHGLQIPTQEDQKFTDDKGNETLVKGGTDHIPTGNYLTSEGKTGNDAWSTRGKWCKAYGKLGKDSISITLIDHPLNPNYPTFWHARGYGLFAANPLAEKIFTNGKSEKNLRLKKGEFVTFRYRILIQGGANTLKASEINRIADEFAREFH
jgi:hypothetical protein